MSLVINFTEKSLDRRKEGIEQDGSYYSMLLDYMPLYNMEIQSLKKYFARLVENKVITMRDVMSFEEDHFFRLFPPESEYEKQQFVAFMNSTRTHFVGNPKPTLEQMFSD